MKKMSQFLQTIFKNRQIYFISKLVAKIVHYSSIWKMADTDFLGEGRYGSPIFVILLDL